MMCATDLVAAHRETEAYLSVSALARFRKSRSYGDFSAVTDVADSEGAGELVSEPRELPAKRRAGSTENLLHLEALAEANAIVRLPLFPSVTLHPVATSAAPVAIRVHAAELRAEPASILEESLSPPAAHECDGCCETCTAPQPMSPRSIEQRFTLAHAPTAPPAALPRQDSTLPDAPPLQRAASDGAASPTLTLPPLPPGGARPCSLFLSSCSSMPLVEHPSLITPDPSFEGASPPSSAGCNTPFALNASGSGFASTSGGATPGGAAPARAASAPFPTLKYSRSEETISSQDIPSLAPASSSLELGNLGPPRASMDLGNPRASMDSFVASSSHLSEGGAAQELFYRLNHARQTLDFVKRQASLYSPLSHGEMGVWDALGALDTLREYETALLGDDDCDPALSLMEHALQTAEACRLAYPDDDWLHLVGLIHDLGKLLAHKDWGSEPQWAVCGETFPVGCRFHPSIMHSQFFSANPDRRRRAYSSPVGIYQPGCGLSSVYMSWSAAEYLYMVLLKNKAQLPPEALFVIRYHRCAVLLRPGAPYSELLSDADRRCLPWVRRFRELARYTRRDLPGRLEGAELRAYYDALIEKYLPAKGTLRW